MVTSTFSLLLSPMLSAPSVVPIYASTQTVPAEYLRVPCTPEMTAQECWSACPKGLQYSAGLHGKYEEYGNYWYTCDSCNGPQGYCSYWARPDSYVIQGTICYPALPPCEPPGAGGYIPNLEECIPVPKTGDNQTDPEPQPPLLPPPPTSPPQGLPQPTQPETSTPMPQPEPPGDVIVKQRPGELIVNKVVINDNGGTKKPSDFTIRVTGNNPTPSSFPGEGRSPGTRVYIDPGEYRVTETLDPGYSTTYSSGCEGTITVQQKICNILNNDKTITVPPQLPTPNATIPELGEETEIPQPEVPIPCLPEEDVDCEIDTPQPDEEGANNQSNDENEQESQESPVGGDEDQEEEESENENDDNTGTQPSEGSN